MNSLCVLGGSHKDLLVLLVGSHLGTCAKFPTYFCFSHPIHLRAWNKLIVADKLRAHNLAFGKYRICSFSSFLSTWSPFPTHPINQYSVLVNNKITERNKKNYQKEIITAILMNELHLKVILKLCFSFFPEHLSFQSNTLTELKTQNNVL